MDGCSPKRRTGKPAAAAAARASHRETPPCFLWTRTGVEENAAKTPPEKNGFIAIYFFHKGMRGVTVSNPETGSIHRVVMRMRRATRQRCICGSSSRNIPAFEPHV
ncbi:hypothetical protein VZT92_021901 [Zoarces viviparus]|uniref:Uncharacterized protein n=1 Tax=Zoarces viviparus TaxID=48416 RepID=A0AAW1E9A7_ZOAVI